MTARNFIERLYRALFFGFIEGLGIGLGLLLFAATCYDIAKHQ